MATKKILVSDNSGSTQEVPSSNIGYNDVTNQISASKITAYSLSSSLPTGILLANGNFISSSVISATGQSGSLLQFSGSAYRLNLPTAIGGDLSGSTTALNNVKVISVANVNSGTLAFTNGGTGLSSSLSGVLIKGAGETLQVLTTADTGSVIGLNADGWFIDNTDPTTNYKPRVDLYSVAGTYTWTKTGNPRFLKILVIGAGGGGGGGRLNTVGYSSWGGGGGGGGASSEIIIEAASITSASVVVGAAGAGGTGKAGPTGGNGTNGASGLSSSFAVSSIGLNIYAGGGGGGTGGAAATITPGGVYGQGMSTTSSFLPTGGQAATTAPQLTDGSDGFYTSGGGAGGSSTAAPGQSGTNSGIALSFNIYSTGSSPNTAITGESLATNYVVLDSYYLNNNTSPTIGPMTIFGPGGGGGGSATGTATSTSGGNGGTGKAGSGGGGGGAKVLWAAGGAGNGGNGGAGAVLVFSY